MKKVKNLDFCSFMSPEEQREFASRYPDDAIFYEWYDSDDIPSYATCSMIIDKAALMNEIRYREELSPSSEDYIRPSFGIYAYLGQGHIFSALNAYDCLSYEGYENLAEEIGEYPAFVTPARMASLYKVYGLYEKGKALPY